MKIIFGKFSLILGLIILLFSLNTNAQKISNYINLSYIVKKLESVSQNNEKIISKLIKEIQERKVDFILTKENEDVLRKKGSNDLLVKTIQENNSKNTLESEIDNTEVLYQKFLNNRKGPTLENYKIALEAAKELIEKYELDPNDVKQYIKAQIPKLEDKIEEISFESGIITDEKEYLWQKFENNRKGPSIENYKKALKAATTYIETFKIECSERTDFLLHTIPKLEAKIKSLQN